MNRWASWVVLVVMMVGFGAANAQTTAAEETISPARPIPTGLAPGMEVKLVSEKAGEQVYAVIFSRGDEVLSGLTDFAIKYKITAAHFTGIGAIKDATVGWLDLDAKAYHPIHVNQQVEVLSMIGDVATFNGKPPNKIVGIFTPDATLRSCRSAMSFEGADRSCRITCESALPTKSMLVLGLAGLTRLFR